MLLNLISVETPPIAGLATGTIAVAASDATGVLLFMGTASGSIAGPASAASAALGFVGTATGSITAPASSAASVLGLVGSATGSIVGPASAATGLETFTGLVTGSITGAASATTGTLGFVASGTGSITGPASSATAQEGFTGTGTNVVAGSASDAAGVLSFAGVGTGSVAGPVSSASGIEAFVGTATGIIAAPIVDGAGEASAGGAPDDPFGDITATVGAPTSEASGEVGTFKPHGSSARRPRYQTEPQQWLPRIEPVYARATGGVSAPQMTGTGDVTLPVALTFGRGVRRRIRGQGSGGIAVAKVLASGEVMPATIEVLASPPDVRRRMRKAREAEEMAVGAY